MLVRVSVGVYELVIVGVQFVSVSVRVNEFVTVVVLLERVRVGVFEID